MQVVALDLGQGGRKGLDRLPLGVDVLQAELFAHGSQGDELDPSVVRALPSLDDIEPEQLLDVAPRRGVRQAEGRGDRVDRHRPPVLGQQEQGAGLGERQIELNQGIHAVGLGEIHQAHDEVVEGFVQVVRRGGHRRTLTIAQPLHKQNVCERATTIRSPRFVLEAPLPVEWEGSEFIEHPPR